MAALALALPAIAIAAPRQPSSATGTCAQTVIGCGGRIHRACSFARIAPVFGSHLLEIDVYGPTRLACGAVDAQLRAAASQLPPRRRGLVGGWRCRWQYATETCARRGAVLWATDPGG